MRLPALLLAAALLTGCGTADSTANEAPVERATMVPDARKVPAAAGAEEAPRATLNELQATADDSVAAKAETMRAVRLMRGVDVSHHQGAIDWERVVGDRIEFAWLKATEGTTFTDPTYVDNRDRARAAGLRVGAYHYFSICGEGAPQAEHFVEVVGKQVDASAWLPPAVDVELDPACSPTRDELLDRLRDFIAVAEKGTGRTVVVYAFPDLERRYRISEELDRPRWVRRLGNRHPEGNWLVWQKSQTASVDGINTPVDLDLMRP